MTIAQLLLPRLPRRVCRHTPHTVQLGQPSIKNFDLSKEQSLQKMTGASSEMSKLRMFLLLLKFTHFDGTAVHCMSSKHYRISTHRQRISSSVMQDMMHT